MKRVETSLGPKRIASLAFAASCIALLAAACDDGGPRDYRARDLASACAAFTTCDTCTPVNGCGWCATSDGGSLCAADPNECAGATEFTWTWDPSGCRTRADAGISHGDAAVDAASE